MSKEYQIEIITPEGVYYKGDATIVSLPSVSGPFQVLYNHAPIVAELEVGTITIVKPDNTARHFACSGGFVEVQNNVVTVMAESIEAADEIDVHRARAALERAEQRIREARLTLTSELNIERAIAAYARARNRLMVAERAGVTTSV